MYRGVVLAFVAWIALVHGASACIGDPYMSGIAYFESAPENLGGEELVLDVEFDDEQVATLNGVVTARVNRVLRGSYRQRTIRVGLGNSSCTDSFQFGRRGIIVGRLVTPAEGQARASQQRLDNLVLNWPFDETVLIPVEETLLERRARTGQAPLHPYAALTSMQALVGDWQGRTETGRAFLVSYRLIANGTVLVESWTMSPTRQSMTVYHMDGEALIAMHYCPQGNQPRLQYRPERSGQRLEFTFRDATNLPDPNAAHQHAFWIEIGPGAGVFTRSETYLENGEAGSELTTFTRIPQPTANP